MKHRYKSKLSNVFAALVAAALTLAIPAAASATCDPSQQSCSSNFGVSQTQFSSGSLINACSHGTTGYCANESAGDLGVGNSASSHYQTQAGSGLTTNREPYIEVNVNAAASPDLGVLSVGNASTTYATFSVKTYLASGYQVQIVGNPPTSTGAGAHTFATMSTPGTSSPGSEQFGINLAANTTACGAPTNFGAGPVQVPDSSFSFGAVADATQNPADSDYYNTCGKFVYHSGDVIADSLKSSGETDYTISFLYNISNLTPDGQYTYNGVIVATSTF